MTTNRSTVDGIAADLAVPNVQTEIIAIKYVGGMAPWDVEWVINSASGTVVSTSLTAELAVWSGTGMSERQRRDVARVLWTLVNEGEVERDCFPDSYLDVVLAS